MTAPSSHPEILNTKVASASLGELVAVLGQTEIAEWSGPLPQPEILEKYDQIVPGAAERIIRMAEKEQSARHELRTFGVTSEFSAIKRGQFIGLVIGVLAMALAAYLIHQGESGIASAMVIATITGFVAVFIYGQSE